MGKVKQICGALPENQAKQRARKRVARGEFYFNRKIIKRLGILRKTVINCPATYKLGNFVASIKTIAVNPSFPT